VMGHWLLVPYLVFATDENAGMLGLPAEIMQAFLE
jgi:hypothetical protein